MQHDLARVWALPLWCWVRAPPLRALTPGWKAPSLQLQSGWAQLRNARASRRSMAYHSACAIDEQLRNERPQRGEQHLRLSWNSDRFFNAIRQPVVLLGIDADARKDAWESNRGSPKPASVSYAADQPCWSQRLASPAWADWDGCVTRALSASRAQRRAAPRSNKLPLAGVYGVHHKIFFTRKTRLPRHTIEKPRPQRRREAAVFRSYREHFPRNRRRSALAPLARIADRDLLEPSTIVTGRARDVQVTIDNDLRVKADVPVGGLAGTAPLCSGDRARAELKVGESRAFQHGELARPSRWCIRPADS